MIPDHLRKRPYRPRGPSFLKGKRLPERTRPLEERFWEKVEKAGPDDCWLWTGSLLSGHGEMWQGSDCKPKKDLAHRISWRIHGGETPKGMFIDHICRVRRCVNPKHLRLVTPRQNTLENNSNPWALNATKDRCKHGHDIRTPGTYYMNRPGQRSCKECARLTALADKMARRLKLDPRPEWLEAYRSAA